MKDYMDIGSSPYEEDCAQVGTPEYHERARAELREFKRMLEAAHPPLDDHMTYYAIKTFPHDFGSYSEVCAVYDDEDLDAERWACEEEVKAPSMWDDQAREALKAYLKE